MKHTLLGAWLYAFFEDYLKCQKGLQSTTIHSYRDAIQLFLKYVADVRHCRLTQLKRDDLTAEQVRGFLHYLECKRHNQVQTRNQRLAAIHTLFEYLAEQDPIMLAKAQQVAAIPVKRASPAETLYLERDEIDRLFAMLPTQGALALRDRALLLFLYNTGARAQEAAELHAANLELGESPRVHLHGKGDKWRVCPLWPQTAALLKQILESRTAYQPENPVFLSRANKALTRFGIYKIVRKHTAKLLKKGADGKPRPISPHVLRHTTAVHLLEAGVEVNVIRAWLGHVSLETTNRYAEINLRMKAEALQCCEPPISLSPVSPQGSKWRDDSALLQWLQSL